jgi:hypothetical protein
MDNPYWTTEGQTHRIDTDSIRRACFELVNIFEASVSLARSFEAQEAEAGRNLSLADYPLYSLHLELAEAQVSPLLLQLCLMVRTYDDIMSASKHADAYLAHVKKTDEDGYVGTLSGSEEFTLREACNKVIHAVEIRPVYDEVDREAPEPEAKNPPDQDVWYLTGEIEIKGTQGKTAWEATFCTQDFVESVLARIAFKPPT